MRIGILVSTQVRESIDKINLNLALLQDAFNNADLILGLWSYESNYLKHFEKIAKRIVLIDEPHIHYHPYKENPKVISNWNYQKKLKYPNDERHVHQTKQILAHNELMKLVSFDYDIIIRCRWDTTISPLIDFMPFVKECYDTPCTVSISTRKDYERSIMHIGEVASWKFPFLNHRDDMTNKVTQSRTCEMLLDNGIIIHRSCDWSRELTEELHTNKKLLAAEFGWWQVLVEGTSHKQWIHYDGGATITRTLIKSDREILKKYESICNYNN